METRDLQVAEKGIEHEMAKIDIDSSEYDDMCVVTAYIHSVHSKKNCQMQATDLTRYQYMTMRQVKDLRWRYRTQEPF